MEDMDFDKSYKQFSKTLKIARRVSVFGAYRKSTGFQMTFASILFARMCVIAQSIQRLTQQDVPTKYVLENWDYASTFGLTRNLMECYHSLFYLCFVMYLTKKDRREKTFLIYMITIQENNSLSI